MNSAYLPSFIAAVVTLSRVKTKTVSCLFTFARTPFFFSCDLFVSRSVKVMENHSQLANCVCGKTMALFKPWRYLVSKPPNLDVAKEAGILCDEKPLECPRTFKHQKAKKGLNIYLQLRI